jgi:hypothetical protein
MVSLALIVLSVLPASAAPAFTAVGQSLTQTEKVLKAAPTGDNVMLATFKESERLADAVTREESLVPKFRRAKIPQPNPAFKPAEIADMLRDAHSKTNLPGEVVAGLARLDQLNGQGRIRFDPRVRDKDPDKADVGLYLYEKGKVHDGDILLSFFLRDMGYLVDLDFLASTLFHEIGHQMDKDLDPKRVIENEVNAFLLEFQWLRAVDPTGYRLAELRRKLQILKQSPNKRGAAELIQRALAYTASLDVLVGTGGDRHKLEKYAEKLYPAGSQHEHLE